MTDTRTATPVVSEELQQQLVMAWERWDAMTGSPVTILAFEQACRAVSMSLTLSSTELRIVLVALRRRGWGRHNVVSEVVSLFTREVRG